MVNDFVLDCREHCFLCLRQIPSSPIVSPVKLGEPEARVPSPPQAYSLQMLSHYLKMDMRKVFQHEDIPPRLLQTVEKCRLKVELCEACALANQQFSNLHQQLEIIQMEMESSLQIIHGKFCEAEEAGYYEEFWNKVTIHPACQSDLTEELIGKLEVLDMLRAEAKQKCSRKINNIRPQVKVQKLTKAEINAALPKYQPNSDAVLSTGSQYTPQSAQEALSEHDDNNIDIGEIKMGSLIYGNLILDDEGGNNFPYSSDSLSTERKSSHGGISIVGVAQDCKKSVAKGSSSKIEQHSSAKQMISPKGGSDRCTVPSKEFKTSVRLSKFKYKCLKCGKDFTTKNICKRHYRTVHLNFRYKCPECGKKFTQKSGLNLHQRRVHLKVKYKCQECEKEYSDKRNLSIHRRSAHLNIKYKCQECEKEYSNKNGLSRHHRVAHLNVKYKCQECEKEYSDKNELSRHHRVAHLNVRFKCPECGKEFSQKSSYNRHQRSAHLKIEYKCPECGMEFSQKSSYNTHHRSAHLKIKYKCQECDKAFSDEKGLSRHHRIVHLNVRFKCPECWKEFSDRSSYNHHHKSAHLNIKYKCQECEKEYSDENGLSRHHRVAHLNVRFKCPECGKEFLDRSSYNRHQRNAHLKN